MCRYPRGTPIEHHFLLHAKKCLGRDCAALTYSSESNEFISLARFDNSIHTASPTLQEILLWTQKQR